MPEITVSVHQPNFLPWLKLLDKILASDVYVAYDTAAYTKSEYHARQRVKRQTGPGWLSVPVLSIRGTQQLIRDVRIDNSQPFRARHLRLLRQEYGRAAYFDEVYPIVAEVYGRGQELLVELNLDLIEAFRRYLESPVRIVRASSFPHDGDRTQRLIQLVREAGGNVHLTSGYGAERAFVDWVRFPAAGIAVRNQLFDHPVYEQPWGDFVPNLAALDMLFCCGHRTGSILRANRTFDDAVLVDLVDPAGTGATGDSRNGSTGAVAARRRATPPCSG